ncbi:MAG: redoxin domain-containing protein [Verrucomicrobiota bacterium]
MGESTPEINVIDPKNNKEVLLLSLKGKYVLLNFTLSESGLKKEEIPFLKEAYEKYHNKGLEIVSIVLDDSKAKGDIMQHLEHLEPLKLRF